MLDRIRSTIHDSLHDFGGQGCRKSVITSCRTITASNGIIG